MNSTFEKVGEGFSWVFIGLWDQNAFLFRGKKNLNLFLSYTICRILLQNKLMLLYILQPLQQLPFHHLYVSYLNFALENSVTIAFNYQFSSNYRRNIHAAQVDDLKKALSQK